MTTATPATDPRAAEAQRRVMLSHRRRLDETQHNAQYNQMLTMPATLPVEDASKRPRHRPATTHRNTTPLHRHAARPATSPAVSP